MVDPTSWVIVTRLAVEALAVGACIIAWRVGRKVVGA